MIRSLVCLNRYLVLDVFPFGSFLRLLPALPSLPFRFVKRLNLGGRSGKERWPGSVISWLTKDFEDEKL